jgi:cytochrome b involved in lipid metabolism
MANDNSDNRRKITPQELADHATAKDCWLLIDGVVYDVTKFLDNHPGGSTVMIEHAGRDCSSNFEDIGMQPVICWLSMDSKSSPLFPPCFCFSIR